MSIYKGLLLVSMAVSLDARIINLTKAKKEVMAYYESGKFEAEVDKVAKKAWRKFDKIKLSSKSTVVFDLDDTLWSSYQPNKRWSFGNVLKIDPQGWPENGELPAIKPMQSLYKKLVNKGFKIVFITSRPGELESMTKKNLAKHGYTKYDKLFISPDPKKPASGSFKEDIRSKLVFEGYKIEACIGDQYSDLKGANTGMKIKIPNYLYEV